MAFPRIDQDRMSMSCEKHGAQNLSVQWNTIPLTRGTHGGGITAICDNRFIPASAGNTPLLVVRYAPSAVHPRVRGEHKRRSRRSAGSPRFIPASAGNTRCHGGADGPSPVHPRVRGEHRPGFARVRLPDGSSPRPRGTRSSEMNAITRPRFIPASAGNTSRR